MATTAQRPMASLDVCHDPHASALLQGLQEQRSENQLVDVVLCVSGKEIPCHRNVLAACSGYFRAMFCNGHLESKERKVVIREASANIVQLLVDFAYTSKVTITEDSAVELMEGANFFQFEPVKDACTKFLSDTLSVTNCLERLSVGNMLMNHHLETSALSYVMKEFTAVTETPEFLELTKEQLITLISSDELNAPEETVYASVMKWIKHAPRKRKKEMRELMELIRFPWMDKMYFIENVQTDKALCKCCPHIVTEAQKYQAFPGEIQSPRTRPRRASGLREAVVVFGGYEKLDQGQPLVFSDAILMTHSSAPSSESWIPMSTMKESNDHGLAVAVLGTSDIIVAGGSKGRNVWLYQANLDSWSELAPMLTNRDYCKLAVVRGKVYAIGGRIGHTPLRLTGDVEVYDRSLNKWTEGVPLPEPRYLHAVAALDDGIYVIGGRDDKDCEKVTGDDFIPGDSQWYSISDMPETVSFITASVLNDSIYVAGPSKVLCYRPQEDLWSVITHIETGQMYRCGMAVFGGEIHIYGGCDNFGNVNGTTKVLQLNREDKSLKQVGTMPKGLFDQVCVTILKG